MDAATANLLRLRGMTEAEWQATVVKHARSRRWMCHFTPDLLYRKGFRDRIPMDQGDRGFPDLVLIAPCGKIVYAELKSETGTLSAFQKRWKQRLLAGGHDWRLWRPRDLDAEVIPTLERWGV